MRLARARKYGNVALVGMSLLLVLAACSGYGAAITESRRVDRLGATSLQVGFDLGTGDLRVRGDATAALNGDFTFNRKLQPEVSYRVQNSRGMLQIRQPERDQALNFSQMNNLWDIRLSNTLPVEINARHESGETRIDLGTVRATRVGVDSGIGNATVWIGGDQPLLEELRLGMGGGNAEVRLTGAYQRLERLKIDSVAGSVSLNLNGAFARNLNASIRASTGTVRVQVPPEVGVIVTASSGAGTVRASGDFSATGQAFTSPSFGRSTITLRIDISLIEGNIEIGFPSSTSPMRPS